MNGLITSCLILFVGRICDVSLGTVRTVLTVKEKTGLAACVGFCEVLIWFIVVRDALNSEYPVYWLALAYAAGYASGTFIGGKLAKLLVPGHVTVEVITSDRSDVIPNKLREHGFALTVINVNESNFGQPKYMIIADVDKKEVKYFEERVKAHDPGAFIIIRDTKAYLGGYMGARK